MFFLAVNIIKKNCVIGKQGFSLFPFFVLGIVPIFANDNYTLTKKNLYPPRGFFERLTPKYSYYKIYIKFTQVRALDAAACIRNRTEGIKGL